MRINRIVRRTHAEGPGIRTAFWVQGCTRACPGCFEQDLWAMDGGTEIPVDDIMSEVIGERGVIEGVTFLGGEPFLQAGEVSSAAEAAHNAGLSVITFTGYRYEELSDVPHSQELLKSTDVLIDGAYIEELRDFSRPLVGSKNQRFIFLTDRYSMDDISSCADRVEIRINKNGAALANGMGDFSVLEGALLDDFFLHHK